MPEEISVDEPTDVVASPDGLPTAKLSRKLLPLPNSRLLPLRWIIWLVMALLYIIPFVLSIPVEFGYLSTECPINPQKQPCPALYPDFKAIQAAGLTTTAVAIYLVALAAITAVVFCLVGLFIIWRKLDDRMAFLVSLTFLTLVSQSSAFIVGSANFIGNLYPLFALLLQFETFIAGVLAFAVFLSFPDGYFIPGWVRWLFLLGVLNEFLYSFVPGTILVGVLGVVKDGLFFITFSSLIFVPAYRFRHLSTLIQRQQTKWVVYGVAVSAGGYGILSTFLPPFVGGFLNTNAFAFLLYMTVEYAFILLIPISFAMAILSSHLWNIDFLINRSVVYGVLTALLIFIFSLVLFTFGVAFQNSGTGQQSSLALLTTGLLFGGIFNPVRRSVQRFVDRRLYGIRIDYQRVFSTPQSTLSISGNTALRRLGSVELLELLGRGGMGEVYKARHSVLGKTVAVKIMSPGHTQDTEYRRRFEREARTVAALKHPNIIQVFDFGEADESLYIIMEYIAGSNVDEFIATNGRLHLTQAVPLLREIASALDYAHGQGIVHRDIKATNVMLEPANDAEYRAVLLDFGIAKMNGGTLLTQDGVIGSLEYIAPEQIQDSAGVDSRADVYAFGVLCYKIITGTLPFKSGNSSALLMAHLYQPPPDPRLLLPELPEDKAVAICRALAKSPDERFPTAGALIRALS